MNHLQIIIMNISINLKKMVEELIVLHVFRHDTVDF